MPAGYTRSNDTGQGATIVFASTAIVADFRSIGETSQESPKIKDTNLTNDEFDSHIPGDVTDPGETECEINFNRRAALPPLNTPQLITITYPLGPGDTAAATFVGTGFIRRRTLPQLATATLQTSKLTIVWDAKATKPAFTAATST
jgi:hypothetical protein